MATNFVDNEWTQSARLNAPAEEDAAPPLDDDENYVEPPVDFKPWIGKIEDGLRILDPVLRPPEVIRTEINREANSAIEKILASTEEFVGFTFPLLERTVAQARTAGIADADISIILLDIPIEGQVRQDHYGVNIIRRVTLSVVPPQENQPGKAVLALVDNFSDQIFYFRPSPTGGILNIPVGQNQEGSSPTSISLRPISLAQALQEPARASAHRPIDNSTMPADVTLNLPSWLYAFSPRGISENTCISIDVFRRAATARARAPQQESRQRQDSSLDL